MTQTTDIGGDVFDIRTVIGRFEELERDEDRDEEDSREYETLRSLLENLAGSGGDEQWRGYWYPVTLIHDSYFKEYAQELAEDIGAIDRNSTWPNNCIDWERAASELQTDYSSVEFDGDTYWYR